MIEIQQIENNSKEDVINLLLDQKKQPFLIYIPKYSQRYYSTNQDIADDYATITYCGELLKSIADKIIFNEISPDEYESVLFKVETNKIEELAEVIFNISKGFSNIEEGEEGMFVEEMYEFLDKVQNKELIPYCKYYYEYFLEFLKYIEESNEDD